MASSRKLPLLFLVATAFLAAAALPVLPAQAEAQEYCGDSLAGLAECWSFMSGGAAVPSAACCAAYSAVYAADPLCLCYVDDGTFWRATGHGDDANVTADSFRIPTGCGQVGPPIEFWCERQGLELPPYGPAGHGRAGRGAAPGRRGRSDGGAAAIRVVGTAGIHLSAATPATNLQSEA